VLCMSWLSGWVVDYEVCIGAALMMQIRSDVKSSLSTQFNIATHLFYIAKDAIKCYVLNQGKK
jgi:hypothetical protein